jgi:hypothetical protein
MIGTIIFVIFLILFIVFIVWAATLPPIPKSKSDIFLDYDWSESWSPLDKKARENADCKPTLKIHRKIGSTDAWIWIVPKTCEQGLPHTRSIDVVALPADYPTQRLPDLLEHERIHLLQRRMPDSWERFYRIIWDYDLYTKPPVGMPEYLIRLIRANPDTASKPWVCWRKRWWSVPVYLNENELSLSRAAIKWWDQEKNVVSKTAPDDWRTFFGLNINQGEHPHELTAEFLSGPLKKGALPDGASEALVRLRKAWDYNSDPQFPSVQ